MTKEEILKLYKISDEEINAIAQKVEKLYTYGKSPVENPTCVIVGGQCGSGKSGLMAYSGKMFPDYNVILLEDDGLRKYFPNEEQISQEYPNEYIAITNQLTNKLTSYLFNKLASEHYNLVFHQTLKNNRIVDEGMEMLLNNGYYLIVRGLAVSEYESRMSMIERCLKQKELTGYYRYVTVDDHNNTYNGMPMTIEYIENSEKYDVLEIFKRGKNIDEPELIYRKAKKCASKYNLNEEVVNLGVYNREKYAFKSAKDALLNAREQDASLFLENYDSRMNSVLNNSNLTPVLSEQAKELQDLVSKTTQFGE